MFKYLEASGLRTFLEAHAIMFKTLLLDFYAIPVISDNGKVTYTHGNKSLTIDKALLPYTFSLSSAGLADFLAISKEAMASVMKNLSDSGEDIYPSC